MKVFTTIVLLAVLAATVIGLMFHKDRPPVVSKPCTDKPCISITEANGAKYQLNDFKFLPGHCIMFRDFASNQDRRYCGQYKLDWIGPQNTKPMQREYNHVNI